MTYGMDNTNCARRGVEQRKDEKGEKIIDRKMWRILKKQVTANPNKAGES